MSDDFFVDEDESPKPSPQHGAPARKPAARKTTPRPVADATASSSIFEQNVSLTIAALIAVIALLLGMIVGILIPRSAAAVDTAASVSTTAASTATSSTSAPQLTQDQLDSGTLPAGHPSISSMTTSQTATSTSSSK